MNSESLPFKVTPAAIFDKKIVIPTSKSHANRALILGAIKGEGFKVNNLPASTDVLHMLAALKKIGLDMRMVGATLTFLNSFPACEKETAGDIISLQTGDGGTTNRFLIALLSRGKKEYHLYPSEKMNERPIDDLIEPLKVLDVKISHNTAQDKTNPWIVIKGPASLYNTTKISIDCSKSTQFASALMLAFFNRPLQFEFQNLHASVDYVKMTIQVIKKSTENNYYSIPVDFSSLGYPLALAALKGKVLVTNCLEIDSFQADAVLIELLKSLGVSRQLTSSGLEIKKASVLKPFTFVVSKAPDLFPTLVFLAAHIDGVTEFSDLKILDFKESSRLHEMIELMNSFGVSYEYLESEDRLKVTGRSKFDYQKAVIYPPRDHRIVMAAALFMKANLGGELYEADCVEKSFPGFFDAIS
jgi:3-phosphoshikimate 1-carboxyvinyltransferase